VRFLLDAGLPVSLADRLRRAGHDAVHVHDEGLARAADIDIFRVAADLPVLTTGAIVVVEDARYRVRRLPIGA
jgi:predicted nuclease of predicted toxin-antitoxin system